MKSAAEIGRPSPFSLSDAQRALDFGEIVVRSTCATFPGVVVVEDYDAPRDHLGCQLIETALDALVPIPIKSQKGDGAYLVSIFRDRVIEQPLMSSVEPSNGVSPQPDEL